MCTPSYSANFNEIEREAITLQFVVESIHSMVNREMLRFSQGNVEIQVTFASPARRELFNVLLADLLEHVDPSLLGVEGSLLEALHRIAREPKLTCAGNPSTFQSAVNDLRDWLGSSIQVDAWFPSIEKKTTLKLQRAQFVTICGNMSKHSFSRLTGTAKRLSRLFSENGIEVSLMDTLQALDDFQSRFQHYIFEYHSTTMAELLNNVRWGIHDYLEPEFARSYTPSSISGDPMYLFIIPDELEHPFAKRCYWDLMNSVRSGPWIERFTGTSSLKGKY